jgi:hypothetical protein
MEPLGIFGAATQLTVVMVWRKTAGCWILDFFMISFEAVFTDSYFLITYSFYMFSIEYTDSLIFVRKGVVNGTHAEPRLGLLGNPTLPLPTLYSH